MTILSALSQRTAATGLGVIFLVAAGTGCGALRRLAGNDTINLEKAEVKSMSVDVRKEKKTICPREPVQMAVFAEVALEGEKTSKPVETWQGKGSVNKNDKLDFVDFAFHSEQGTFNDQGWFQPNPSVLATAGKEFEIKSVFKRRPDKFSFTTNYKPDYACITSGGKSGTEGQSGSSGREGQGGEMGQSGSQQQAGGPGRDGGQGAPGGNGTDGAAGPKLVVYATMAKTAFYDRLVAVRVTGDIDDFILLPEGQPITLRATGGSGGSGGRGGAGGHGGQGGSGNPGGQGGRGGAGGNGGSGGNGGPGGSIDLVYDARFADLGAQLKLSAAGGDPGGAGASGSGGSAGPGGSGQAPSGMQSQSGQSGAAGPDGANGAGGRKGPDGRAVAKPGVVKDKFGDLPGVTLL